MDTFTILWNVKYKQLDKYRWSTWYDRFSSEFRHSRWYDYRRKTAKQLEWKVFYKTVKYSTPSNLRYHMKCNIEDRILDNENYL